MFNKLCFRFAFLIASLFEFCLAHADIEIGEGTDHAKDFDVINSIGKTTQSLLFGVGAKTAGSVCGIMAIVFLAKRRYGLCATFVICSIAFFASKALVNNFASFE